jgi:hypothetical protein
MVLTGFKAAVVDLTVDLSEHDQYLLHGFVDPFQLLLLSYCRVAFAPSSSASFFRFLFRLLRDASVSSLAPLEN